MGSDRGESTWIGGGEVIKLFPGFYGLDLEPPYEKWSNGMRFSKRVQEKCHAHYGRESLFDITNVSCANIKLSPPHLLPCVKLPYPFVWMEFTNEHNTFGIAMTDRMDGGGDANKLEDYDLGFEVSGTLMMKSPNKKQKMILLAAFGAGLNERGQFISGSFVESGAIDSDSCNYVLVCVWNALSLLHCKNVRTVDHRPNPKVNRKRQRKGKKPLLSYKTLEVTASPIKPNSNTEETTVTAGSKKRRHTVRGHFRDYRKGNGLFGKHKGIYWTGPMLRGHAEEGFVVKDYEVTK